MKLDDDELRTALLRVEQEIDQPEANFRVSADAGFAQLYAFRQLIKAGYVDALDNSSFDGEEYVVRDLTFAGHQLLKRMRNDTVWSKTKAKIKELGGEVPLRVLEKLLDEGWDRLVG